MDNNQDDLLTADTLQQWCQEIREQPRWRKEADKCEDYYCGNQIDRDTAEALQDRGMGELIANLVAPTINTVLGLEAKTRSDWRVVADSDDQQEVAEALSARLTEAERESRADRACSDAYAAQIKSGLGWVAVIRDPDPFKYQYKACVIDRREMYWDWSAREHDLSDARYVLRKRWFGLDQACAFMPEHAEILRGAGTGWTNTIDLATDNTDNGLLNAFDQERRYNIFDYEWRDTSNRRICLYEVWYRKFVRGLVVETPDGRVVEFDEANPVHQMGVATGVMQPREAVYSRLRVSLWVGPHKLSDEDYGVARLPYIPFWGYREDRTSSPYGMIRAMIPMQDEVNARRRKLLWMLSAKAIQADSDALDNRYNDFGDVAREVARPDAVIVTNPARTNKSTGVIIQHAPDLSQQQFQVMQESKEAIQQVAGVFNAMMGRDSNATSGLAINSLVEQGSNALGEINDNYRYARRLVGEALLELIRQDMNGDGMEAFVGEQGRRKTIVLNVPVVDPATGLTYRHNDVQKARVKVALEDIPSTPAYKAQQQMQIAEVLKSMPPQLQAPLIPYFLESTDLPKRREMADQVRKAMGIQGEDGAQVDPAVAQMEQQMQMMQQQMQAGAQQYEQMIAQLQQQLQEAQGAAKEKDTAAQLKLAELRQKEADATRNYGMDAERLRLEQEKLAIEREKVNATLRAAAEKEMTARAALQAEAERARQDSELRMLELSKEPEKEPEMPDVAAEIAKAIQPVVKAIDEIKSRPEPEEREAQPLTINLQVDAKSGAVKKEIKVERDKSGNIIGATSTETE